MAIKSAHPRLVTMSKCKENDGRSLSAMTKVINLVLISASNLFGGVSLSLLSPFYSAEALLKGVSVTKSGLVFGSVFVTTVLCTPVIGRYIEVLGARKFLLLGSAICALGNIAFGTLCLVQVQGKWIFFTLHMMMIIFKQGQHRLLPAVGFSSSCDSCRGVGSSHCCHGSCKQAGWCSQYLFIGFLILRWVSGDPCQRGQGSRCL